MKHIALILMGIGLCLGLIHCGSVIKKFAAERMKDPAGRLYMTKEEGLELSMLGPAINSSQAESSPIISPDGRTLFFIRLFPHSIGLPESYIYWSQRKENGWSEALRMEEPFNQLPINELGSITSDGQMLVFSSRKNVGIYSDQGGDTSKIYKSIGAGIQIAIKKKGWFQVVEEVKFFKGRKTVPYKNIFGSYSQMPEPSFVNPTISSDGTMLLFGCDVEGGYGGFDLYISRKGKDGNWQVPVNLGSRLNTVGNEICPFLHADNKTLYFSSNGLPGIGLYDIYRTVKQSDGWSHPELIGSPVSSPAADVGFSISARADSAYVASNRNHPDNIFDYDIFALPVKASFGPQTVMMLTGKITDGLTQHPLESSVEIENLSLAQKLYRMQSDYHTGHYAVTLPKGQNYAVSASKPGYTFFSTHLDLSKTITQTTVNYDIVLWPIKKGATLTLHNLFFDFNSDKIKPESDLELLRTAELLNDYAQFQIEIAGHTDNVGTAAYNKKLSDKRADAVKKRLSTMGIPASRLKAIGYGSEKPIAPNDTDKNKAKNRRVELIFK